MQNENGSWINQLPPKFLFLGGLIGGILVLCTIGFFILLGMVVSGGKTVAYNAGANAAPAQPTQPAQPDQGQGAQPQIHKPADVTSDEHITGNTNAKVTLIEYSDFQCPFCQRFHPVADQIVKESNGKVRWVFRPFPLTQIHPFAEKAAETGECVASLKGNDAYWKFANLMFTNQATLSDSMMLDMAAQAGASRTAIDACVKSGKFAAKVAASEQEGSNDGVQGTPSTFVIAADGSFELIPGALPYDQAKAYVDRALAK